MTLAKGFFAQALFAKSPNPRIYIQRESKAPSISKHNTEQTATMQEGDLGEIKGRDED
jgi:hypothetical protein